MLAEARNIAYVSAFARALDSVSFSLPPGTICAVVGESGTGKTLLLRILCGLERPSEGQLLYDGVDVRGYSERQWRRVRRELGVVIEGVRLISDLTLAENIIYPLLVQNEGLENLGTSLEFALAYFDLYAWRYAVPADLSDSLMRRALLARAMICQPKLLLCDNLFDGAQGQERADLRDGLTRYVSTRPSSLLFTTRDEDDARFMGAMILTLS